MAATDFRVWLAPVSAEINGRTLSLSLSGGSGYMARRLEQKFGSMILDAASKQLQCRPEEVVLHVRGVPGEGQAASDSHDSVRTAKPGLLARPEPIAEKKTQAPKPEGRRARAQERASRTEKSRVGKPAPVTESAPAPLPLLSTTPVHEDGSHSGKSGWTMVPQPLVRSLPLDQGATISGDAAIRKQWRYCFDDFVVGDCNALAMTAARDVCRSTSGVETLFVSSEPGLGKTHIVQSAVRQILEDRGSSARVAYLTGDEFYTRFRYGLVNDSLDDFVGRVRALDFLLVDDVQSLRGKSKTQEVLLSVVKHLRDRGSRVVFASRYMARDLKQLDPQLVSLVSSGIQASMERPDYETRCGILRHKAQAQQEVLPEEIIAILADGLEGDVRQMESCLQTLIYRTRTLNRKITPELAIEVLSQVAGPRREKTVTPSFDGLLSCVSREYGLTEKQICSCLRRRNFVEARNVLFYLARKYTTMTLVQIGARVNKRHSTVIKGIATVEERLSSETLSGRQTARVVHLIERSAGIITD